MEIKIGNLTISNKGKPCFIADIAANHDGDLGRALALIDLAKEAGADVAKFQNFKAETIVSKNGFDTMPKLAHQANWAKPVFDVYKDASINSDWTPILKAKCDDVGIEYMTSPYDFASVDWAEPYVDAYKIGSGDITWLDIIEHIAKKRKPVLLATGASDLEDVKRAYHSISLYNNEIVMMQCNTNYTKSPQNFKYINLNVLRTYAELFPNCVLGLSDHTYGYVTVLGALALGARVFEKHFTDDNDRTGPDHKFAMNPKTWREMVDAANDLYYALGDGNKVIEENELDASVVQRRALYLNKDLKAGDTVCKSDIIPLRPIRKGGIPPYRADLIIGKKLLTDKNADTYMTLEDINND